MGSHFCAWKYLWKIMSIGFRCQWVKKCGILPYICIIAWPYLKHRKQKVSEVIQKDYLKYNCNKHLKQHHWTDFIKWNEVYFSMRDKHTQTDLHTCVLELRFPVLRQETLVLIHRYKDLSVVTILNNHLKTTSINQNIYVLSATNT